MPWTKPEDLPFDMSVPLFGLGSHHGDHNNGFNVVFADNSVRFLGDLNRAGRHRGIVDRATEADKSGRQSY